jgi:hypothetical protein
MRTLPLLCLLVAAACGGARNAPVPDSAPQETLVGQVALTGSEPVDVHITLMPDSGGGTYLDGPLSGELRRLGGVRVEVWGERSARGMRVAGYRIVSVDGAPVWLGVVERAQGGLALRLEDGSLVRLRYPPAALQPGNKAWVQGPSSGGEVSVQTFSIVTPQ